MATYGDIQNWVRQNFSFVPKSCWIAHVMTDFKLTTRVAGNRLHPTERTNPCPSGWRRDAIVLALAHFELLSQTAKKGRQLRRLGRLRDRRALGPKESHLRVG
jgi:hypothetical protein